MKGQSYRMTDANRIMLSLCCDCLPLTYMDYTQAEVCV